MKNADISRGAERQGIGADLGVIDIVRPRGIFKLEKFDVTKNGIVAPTPHEVLEFSNLLSNVGIQLLEDLLIGAGGTVLSNANAHIGVGNGTTAPSAAHTDLQGASKTRMPMQATFPSRTGQILTFKSVFDTGDANYAWEEMAVFNAAAAGIMFCRALVSSPFTKTSALAITATYTWSVS